MALDFSCPKDWHPTTAKIIVVIHCCRSVLCTCTQSCPMLPHLLREDNSHDYTTSCCITSPPEVTPQDTSLSSKQRTFTEEQGQKTKLTPSLVSKKKKKSSSFTGAWLICFSDPLFYTQIPPNQKLSCLQLSFLLPP